MHYNVHSIRQLSQTTALKKLFQHEGIGGTLYRHTVLSPFSAPKNTTPCYGKMIRHVLSFPTVVSDCKSDNFSERYGQFGKNSNTSPKIQIVQFSIQNHRWKAQRRPLDRWLVISQLHGVLNGDNTVLGIVQYSVRIYRRVGGFFHRDGVFRFQGE